MRRCYSCMKRIEGDVSICPNCNHEINRTVEEEHILPGTLLKERFEVGYALGQGGFGITYIGYDRTLDKRVAIKEYFPSGIANRANSVTHNVACGTIGGERYEAFDAGKERFLREARSLAKFSDLPGIVNVSDYFEENGTGYIVMEYIDGETLKKYIERKGILTFNEVLGMLTPVFNSLKKVHEQGLIHRDISPDNIMLTDSSVKLIDFGAVRDLSLVGNKSMSVMLKPGYAPEEQSRSRGAQGPWTDVYALCATIYKCITGITPDEAPQRAFQDEMKKPSELGANISPTQEAALMKGLAVYAVDRYQNIDELLAGFAGEEPVPGVIPEIPKKKKGANNDSTNGSKKIPVALIIALVAVLVIGIGAFAAIKIIPGLKGSDNNTQQSTNQLTSTPGANTEVNKGMSETASNDASSIPSTSVEQAEQEVNPEDNPEDNPDESIDIGDVEFIPEEDEIILDVSNLYKNGDPGYITDGAFRWSIDDISGARVGDIVTFGVYEQNAELSDGDEPIDWQIVDIQDGKALLVSAYTLDCQPYNLDDEAVTWRKSYLRNWLNEDFIEEAFTEEEQKYILTSQVRQKDNPEYGTSTGTGTSKDKIFILSAEEVEQYWPVVSFGLYSEDRMIHGTKAAIMANAYYVPAEIYNDGFSVLPQRLVNSTYWWVRTAGIDEGYTSFVDGFGIIDYEGALNDADDGAVRPAMWVSTTGPVDDVPTSAPEPILEPTSEPTITPVPTPTVALNTPTPVVKDTGKATPTPTKKATPTPTKKPTPTPTKKPTPTPTKKPTPTPTKKPTPTPTKKPTPTPTKKPTSTPTPSPTPTVKLKAADALDCATAYGSDKVVENNLGLTGSYQVLNSSITSNSLSANILGTTNADNPKKNETIDRLFDNSFGTRFKYTGFSKPDTLVFEFAMDSKVNITHYVMFACEDSKANPSYNPDSWVIYGSNNSKADASNDWTKIESQSGKDMRASDYAGTGFEIDSPGSYKYYKIELKTTDSNTMQLSEIWFLQKK